MQIINFVNNHEALYTALRDDGAKALFHGAETRMAKELLAAESVLQDKEHLQRLWLSKVMKETIENTSSRDKVAVQLKVQEMQDSAVMNNVYTVKGLIRSIR